MIRIVIPVIISLAALIFVLWLIFNKRQKSWDEMSEQERKRKKLMIFSGITVFIAGIASAIFLGKKEKNKLK
jgi:Na+/H+ antiporter NhaD/arsenite permease-like protein